MVKVRIKRKNTSICEVEIKDHAGYADAGQDLVCAGVSSIAVGMMNALDLLVPNTCEFEMKSAYIKIKIIQPSADVNLLSEALLYQLQTLKENYQTYITINDQEV